MVEMAARAGAGPLELTEGAGGVGKQNRFGVQKGMRGVLVVSLSLLNSSSFFSRRARAPRPTRVAPAAPPIDPPQIASPNMQAIDTTRTVSAASESSPLAGEV